MCISIVTTINFLKAGIQVCVCLRGSLSVTICCGYLDVSSFLQGFHAVFPYQDINSRQVYVFAQYQFVAVLVGVGEDRGVDIAETVGVFGAVKLLGIAFLGVQLPFDIFQRDFLPDSFGGFFRFRGFGGIAIAGAGMVFRCLHH